MARSTRMNSTIRAALLALSLLLPGLAHATEGTPGLNASGPGGGVWGVMQRHSEVARIGARAMGRIVRQNDSGLALICFDRSLALSSRLGAIYSDVPPPKIMPVNTFVFDGGKIYNKYAGIGLRNGEKPNMLVSAYASLSNSLDTYMGNAGIATLGSESGQDQTSVVTPQANFSDSITDGMGATQVQVLPLLEGAVYNLARGAGGTGGFSDSLLELYPMPLIDLFDYERENTVAWHLDGQLDGAYQKLEESKTTSSSYGDNPNVIQNVIPEYYAFLTAAMEDRHAIYDGINDPDDGLAAGFTYSFLDPEAGLLAGARASLTGLSWPELNANKSPNLATSCSYISYLFGGIPGNKLLIQGLTKSGPDMTKPYYTYSDLATGAVQGAGPAMWEEMSGGGNGGSVRDLARDDLINVLRTPGTPTSLSNWVAAPDIPQDATPDDIVGLMP